MVTQFGTRSSHFLTSLQIEDEDYSHQNLTSVSIHYVWLMRYTFPKGTVRCAHCKGLLLLTQRW